MQQYVYAKQYMEDKMRHAETMRQIKDVQQPLYKRLTAFLSQYSSATQANKTTMTATQQFKPTTSRS